MKRTRLGAPTVFRGTALLAALHTMGCAADGLQELEPPPDARRSDARASDADTTRDARGSDAVSSDVARDSGRVTDAGTPIRPAADAGSEPVYDAGSVASALCSGHEADFEALVARLTADLSAHHIPGGAIAVLCGDRVMSRGVGVVRAGASEAVNETTRFQMASVTKSFTAATAELLAVRGVVSMATPGSTYVPFANLSRPYSRSATLDEILAHAAGYPTEYITVTTQPDTLEGAVRSGADNLLWSPPGAVFNYSNLGYMVAGLGLERAARVPFGRLVETTLFAPLGMTGARMDANAVLREGRFASGHAGSAARPLGPLDSYYHTAGYGPMGGAWASVNDLAQFGRMLAGARPDVMPESARVDLERPRIHTYYPGRDYALGLLVDPGSSPRVSHSGSVPGFLTEFDVVPGEHFGVFVAVNGDWYFPSEVIEQAFSRFSAWHPEASGDAPAMTECVGRYRAQVRLGDVEVRASGARLTLQIGTRAAVALTEAWPGSFSFTNPLDGREAIASFVRDEAGRVRRLVTSVGVAERL